MARFLFKGFAEPIGLVVFVPPRDEDQGRFKFENTSSSIKQRRRLGLICIVSPALGASRHFPLFCFHFR